MIPGAYSLAEQAILGLDPDHDFSVGSPFAELLADPMGDRVYLVEATPYDLDAAAEVSRYASDRGYISHATDTPASTLYPARASRPYELDKAIRLQESFAPRSVRGRGEIRFAAGDGGIDDWLDLSWDGRSVTVLLGRPTFARAEFGVIFSGRVRSVAADTRHIELEVVDPSARLDHPIQGGFYAGTGGSEGGDDLEDKPVPLCYGVVRNVEPVLVDASTLLYQVHDGQIEAVDACYVNGDPLSFTAGSPSAGEYTTDLSAGTITLGGTPSGRVTADVQGSKTGGTYVSTVRDIVRRIVVDQGGLTDPDDLDTASFDDLGTRAPYTAGIYLTDATKMVDVVDRLMAGIGGFWGWRRDGRMHVGLIRPPGSPSASFTDAEILAIEREHIAPPAWRIRIGYQRTWRVHSENEIAGAASDAVRSRLLQQFREVAAEDAAVQTAHAKARDAERVDSHLDAEADAQAVVDRLLVLHGTERQRLRVTVKTQPFTFDVGDSVEVTYSRLGLSAGRRFRVIGLEESAGSSRVTLTLWG